MVTLWPFIDLSLYTRLTQSSSGVGHQDRDRSLKGAAFFLSGLEGQWDLGHTDAMNITCYVFTDYPLGWMEGRGKCQRPAEGQAEVSLDVLLPDFSWTSSTSTRKQIFDKWASNVPERELQFLWASCCFREQQFSFNRKAGRGKEGDGEVRRKREDGCLEYFKEQNIQIRVVELSSFLSRKSVPSTGEKKGSKHTET